MKRPVGWTVVIVAFGVVCAWLWGLSQDGRAQAFGNQESAVPLIVLKGAIANGGQQLVLIEPGTRVMCAYHVDGQSGEISLKSVRNFSWDLFLEEFNGVKPSPREIKELLEKR